MSNDEIIRLIGKIRERFDQIHDAGSHIASIDVDLLKADIRELYENISLLGLPQRPETMPLQQVPETKVIEKESATITEPISAAAPEAKMADKEETIPQDPKNTFHPDPVMEIPVERTVASPVMQVPEPETFSRKPVNDPVYNMERPAAEAPPVVHQTPIMPPLKESHVHEPTNPVHSTLDLFGSPTTTLADKFKEDKRSINDKLNPGTAAESSIGSRLRLKITDLRAAIGINDRFIFINELFEGEMRQYDDLLVRLNSCDSLQTALDIFNNTRAIRGWSDDLSSVERLLDFIHRRYA